MAAVGVKKQAIATHISLATVLLGILPRNHYFFLEGSHAKRKPGESKPSVVEKKKEFGKEG